MQAIKDAILSNIQRSSGIIKLAACAGLLFVIAWNADEQTVSRTIDAKSDQAHHILVAENLFHFRAHAAKMDSYGNPVPTAYREPLYSVYLSLVIALNPNLQSMDIKTLLSKTGGVRTFQRSLIGILLLTSLVSMVLVILLTGKTAPGFIVMVLVGFSRSMLYSIQTLKVELFAAMWVILLSVALIKAFQTQKYLYMFLSGLVLGLLVLDRAIFMYFIGVLVAVFFVVWWKKYRRSPKALIGAVVFLCAYALAVCPWLIRNRIHFGSFFITYRAGVVLAIRSQYNKMNDTEFRGAFLYWMPGPDAEQSLIRTYGKGYDKKDGPLARLNRENRGGFYKTGRRMRNRIFETAEGSEIEKEQLVKKAALKSILDRPWDHLAVSIPIAWQGLFVEDGYLIKKPFSLKAAIPETCSLIYYISFFALLVFTVVTRRWILLPAASPVLYLFFINALFTHGLPRYNQPAVPVLAVFTLLFFFLIVCQMKTLFSTIISDLRRAPGPDCRVVKENIEIKYLPE